MPPRDYYIVLGIPRNESHAGVRAAYRDLAKRYHPDHAGDAELDRFREIVDAYGVLGHPDARRAYDARSRRNEAAPRAPRRTHAERRTHGEELVPRPLDLFAEPDEMRPSAEALRARIERNFSGRGIPKAERAQALTCNIVLTRGEAASGGVLPIDVPMLHRCSTCQGAGRTVMFPCVDCDATGYRTRQREVAIRIPPGIASGSRIAASLEGSGIRNLVLEVLVRVSR